MSWLLTESGLTGAQLCVGCLRIVRIEYVILRYVRNGLPGNYHVTVSAIESIENNKNFITQIKSDV